MKLNRKIFLCFGTITTTFAPIISVVSCNENKKQEETKEKVQITGETQIKVDVHVY